MKAFILAIVLQMIPHDSPEQVVPGGFCFGSQKALRRFSTCCDFLGGRLELADCDLFAVSDSLNATRSLKFDPGIRLIECLDDADALSFFERAEILQSNADGYYSEYLLTLVYRRTRADSMLSSICSESRICLDAQEYASGD